MFNKHTMAKVAVLAVVLVSVVVLSLMLVNGSSEAAGPGGRGRGNGGTGGGNGANGANGQGLTTGDQLQQNLMDGTGTGSQTGSSWQGANGNGNSAGTMSGGLLIDLPAATPGDLPADVIDAMTAGIMDEYNAYLTYQAVIDQFGAVRPFTNIQRSEQSHIDALAFLFERYGLDVPQAATQTAVPQFASIEDACALGAAAEIANLSLYDEWMATVSNYPDIVQVFTGLRDASEFQHLPAFEVCAS